MMNIFSGYNLGFIILCIATGAIYAIVLYTGKKSKIWKKVTRNTLFIIRFILVSLLAFFLLDPMLGINNKIKNKPILAIAVDNSMSMKASKDSIFVKNNLLNILNEWAKKNSNKIEIAKYSFGDSLTNNFSNSFNQSKTDIGNVFKSIANNYINKNLIGIVIVSDGIWNIGVNPMSAISQINVPVFSVGVGDTTEYTDAAITSLIGNREVVYKNYFPIEFSILVSKAKGKQINVALKHNENEIFKQNIDIQSNNLSRIFNAKSFADKKGLNKISLSISNIDGEKNTENNTRIFYFNVVDEIKKVLIVSTAPHPDIRALRVCLEHNLNYSVKSIIGENNVGDISEYDLIIAHQIPTIGSKGSLLEKAKASKTPMWICSAQNTNFSAINNFNIGLNINIRNKTSENEITSTINEKFPLFSISQQEIDFIKSMPPLTAQFGNFNYSAGVDVLIWQKIGNVISTQPLFCFTQVENQRWAFLLAEGIWRWRLFDFQNNNSFNIFDTFFSRIAQFLCQNNNKSRFKVIYDPTHSEAENIIFEAELYNENYELINNEQIDLNLRNKDGKVFSYSFIPDGFGYSLNCGQIKAGEYDFIAQVKSKKYPFSQKGKITIDNYNIELSNTKADFNILNQLSKATNGIFVLPNELEKINQFLDKEKLISTTYYYEKKYTNLIDWKWILMILIALASFEWIIRKREGYY